MPPVGGFFIPLLCLCTCLHAVSAQSVPNFGLGLAYGFDMQLPSVTNVQDFQNAAPAKWWASLVARQKRAKSPTTAVLRLAGLVQFTGINQYTLLCIN